MEEVLEQALEESAVGMEAHRDQRSLRLRSKTGALPEKILLPPE
jgi:hypothetical protein